MPYDSNGNYTLPDTYFVENGDTVLPIQHNPPLEDIQAALSAVVLRSGVAPMSGDLKMGTKKVTGMGDGTATTDAVTKGQLDRQSVKFTTKSANYTAVSSDNNATIRFTGAYTLSLDDAATLGASWSVNVAAGGGTVTIDPDASETVNGLSTLKIYDGQSASIFCDGSNFVAQIRGASAWETIREDTLVNVAAYDVTDLSAFRALRISGHIYPSVDASVFMRTSTNNGVSYDSGASDYGFQYMVGTGTTSSANSGNTSSINLSQSNSVESSPDDGMTLDLMFENFNKNINLKGIGTLSYTLTTAFLLVGSLLFRRNQATARNAFRIATGAGTLSGVIVVEGIRG